VIDDVGKERNNAQPDWRGPKALPMTIRGGGDPAPTHGLPSRGQEWAPPPRSSAADAYDCIMVPILERIGRIQGCDAIPASLMASSPRNCRRLLPLQEGSPRPRQACRCARDGQGQVASRWPPLGPRLDRRCARRPVKARSGRGDGRQLAEQGDEEMKQNQAKSSLTIIVPYKGGRRPSCSGLPLTGASTAAGLPGRARWACTMGDG
jgi:hypothetical protein